MTANPLLQNTKKLLNEFLDSFNPVIIDTLAENLKDRPGLIFFTGVGKSGLVAQKIAVSMTSTGTRAIFLSPTDSLHGDIGLVGKGDTVFLLSKSGESDEIMTMVPYLRNRGAELIAVVAEPKSRLAKACDQIVYLPYNGELCPHDMAPTISTTSQLIFGDILTVALMEAKKFTASDFALNHPAGRLGKRATMKVQDLMLQGDEVPIKHADDKLLDSLVELSDKRAGTLLIKDDDGRLLGIFTDGDLRRALQKNGAGVLNLPLKDIMTKEPKKVFPELLLIEALKMMEENQKFPIMVLPVVDAAGKIKGLLKLHDIIQAGV